MHFSHCLPWLRCEHIGVCCSVHLCIFRIVFHIIILIFDIVIVIHGMLIILGNHAGSRRSISVQHSSTADDLSPTMLIKHRTHGAFGSLLHPEHGIRAHPSKVGHMIRHPEP